MIRKVTKQRQEEQLLEWPESFYGVKDPEKRKEALTARIAEGKEPEENQLRMELWERRYGGKELSLIHISLQRREDVSKAYFGCHTDITIPYEELALIRVERPDGTGIDLIRDGRFVLPGTEELNQVFG